MTHIFCMSPLASHPPRCLLEGTGDWKRMEEERKSIDWEMRLEAEGEGMWEVLWSGFVPMPNGETEVVSHSRARLPPSPFLHSHHCGWCTISPRLTSALSHHVECCHSWRVTCGFVGLSYPEVIRSFLCCIFSELLK